MAFKLLLVLLKEQLSVLFLGEQLHQEMKMIS